ncbi:MAG: PEP-CTERM sorting domain-containing protein [Planctomycetota bacterium]
MTKLFQLGRNSVIIAVGLILASTANAGLLPTPDILVSFGADYSSADQRLTVLGDQGIATRLLTDADPDPNSFGNFIFGGSGLSQFFGQFELEVSIDQSGNVFTSPNPSVVNEFVVRGSLVSNSEGTMTLLKGTITEARTAAFGTGGVIDLVATVTENNTGEPFGKTVRITAQNLGIGNSFLNDFSISSGQANIGRPVPEPTSLACFGVFACGLAVRRKLRS